MKYDDFNRTRGRSPEFSHNYSDSPDDSDLIANAGLQDDIVIAVIGTTSSGKSSFVRLLSGDTSIAIGDNLSSETSEIQVVRFFDRASRRNVIIVDTPGFDDSREGVSDTEILKRITSFLLEMYDGDRKLDGLIYLQRISDPRFGGQSGRNLKMFRNLCGTDTFSNVVVLTTFWDKLASAREGEMREMQLMREHFKVLVDGGARFMRHDRSAKSAQLVLDHILRLTLKNVEDTVAGSVHRKEVEEIIARYEKEVAELKAEMDDIKKTNKLLVQELEKGRAEFQKMEKWEMKRLELQKGLDDEKKAVAKLTLDLDAQKLANEERTGGLDHDWTYRLPERNTSKPPRSVRIRAFIKQGVYTLGVMAHNHKYACYDERGLDQEISGRYHSQGIEFEWVLRFNQDSRTFTLRPSFGSDERWSENDQPYVGCNVMAKGTHVSARSAKNQAIEWCATETAEQGYHIRTTHGALAMSMDGDNRNPKVILKEFDRNDTYQVWRLKPVVL